MASNHEPYGTTPLPVEADVMAGVKKSLYDPSHVWDVAQQPKSQQIAVYEGTKIDGCVNGASVLDVNQHFVVYAVKKGLIRILHRHSTLRTLFRGHEGQRVTDIRFFLDGDVLGSVGTSTTDSTSCVIIWRVFERTPEIMSEKLLEIKTPAFTIDRMIWHPFNPNQFWILHHQQSKKSTATLVETTKITTVPHATDPNRHAVCQFHSEQVIMDGAIQIHADDNNEEPSYGAGSLTDLDWSEKDVRHVLTTHCEDSSNSIRLWDLKKLRSGTGPNLSKSATLQPECLCTIYEQQPLSRCKFLPQESAAGANASSSTESTLTNCFLTSTNQNSMITLWAPFNADVDQPPTKLQIFGLQNPTSSYLLDICYGPGPPDGPPPSLFVLMADQIEGKLFAWHLQSEWIAQGAASDNTAKTLALRGCDYVVPFETCYPMYSWSTKVAPAADISEEDLAEHAGLVFDMKLFSYQSVVVQCLTLTSFMCLPPESTWNEATPGITVELEDKKFMSKDSGDSLLAVVVPVTNNIATTSDVDDFDEEEYDVGDVDDDDDDDEDEDEDDDENNDYNAAPEPSSLPTPDEFGGGSPIAVSGSQVAATAGGPFSKNAFSNWLGAIAAKSSDSETPAPPPPPPPGVLGSTSGSGDPIKPAFTPISMPPIPPAPVVGGGNNDSSSLLSNLLPPAPPVIPPPPGHHVQPQQPKTKSPVGESRGSAFESKKKKKSSRKNTASPKHGGGFNPMASKNGGKKIAPITILKREDGPVVPTQQAASSPPQAATTTQQVTSPPAPPSSSLPTPAAVSSTSTAISTNSDIEAVLNNVLKTHMTTQGETMKRYIQSVVEKEVRKSQNEATSAIISRVDELIHKNTKKAIQPINTTMDALINKSNGKVNIDSSQLAAAVSESIEGPLRTALAENMKSIFIPAFEAVTGQMFVQISDSLEKGLISATSSAVEKAGAAFEAANNKSNAKKDNEEAMKKSMEEVSAQMSSMVNMVQKLTSEVESLRGTVAAQQTQMTTMFSSIAASGPASGVVGAPPESGGAPPGLGAPMGQSPPVDPLQGLRDEIRALLSQRQYEVAFNKALSTSNVQLTVFCCANADLADVLGGFGVPKLSQAILLCLMHQLGSNLINSSSNNVEDYTTELSWLQEIAVSVNPSDATIERHFPGVLHQLNVGINAKMSHCDPSLRRPLQRLAQVFRGMQAPI